MAMATASRCLGVYLGVGATLRVIVVSSADGFVPIGLDRM
jgi:hypothetical protein